MPYRVRWRKLGLLALVAYGVFGIKLASAQLQQLHATPFDRAEMLTHLAYHVMLPTYLDFAEAAEALHGMRFAWRVMLVEKTGHVDFEVREAQSGHVWWVSPDDYLTPRRANMMATRPAMIQQFAQIIARDFSRKGWRDVSVHAAAYVSLNGRPSQRFIDFDVDLAQTRQALSEVPWILPLQESVPIRLHAMSPRSVAIRSPRCGF